MSFCISGIIKSRPRSQALISCGSLLILAQLRHCFQSSGMALHVFVQRVKKSTPA